MKIVIDRDGCIECGACEATCPTVFQLKDGDKASIVEKYRLNSHPGVGKVGEDLNDCAQEAADSCPVEVISTE